MLKIAEYNTITGEKVELKELEKYGFKEYNDYWQRDYNNGYATNIYKDTKQIIKVDYEWSFLENKYYENSTYKINDLIKDGFIIKED